ncbi:hypothetical protein ABBQ38_001291 [Trebouxia sp. C0009 RCD-2024]
MSEALCVDLLVRGQPQAFVDLFSLTHSSNDTASSTTNASSTPQPASLPEETAAAISQELVVAHDAQREGDFEASYNAYQQLAEHFPSYEHLPNAKLFYTRCLQIATEHSWTEGQAAAHTNLGTS